MASAQAEAAEARTIIYYELAEALAGPRQGIQKSLLEAVTIGARVLVSAACREAALILAELPLISLEVLRRSYTLLIASPDRQPLALYESLYLGGGLMGQLTWQVERHYRALGLAPVKGELPDHASVELAFLGHLTSAEAEARKGGDRRLIARLKAEQRLFLHRHAGRWLPEVGSALASTDNRFYAAVGRLLRGFLAEELTGRQRNGQTGIKLPGLKNADNCTLCGLCVGSCPMGALRVIESSSETTLTLNAAQCIGCNRCERTCPEGALLLSAAKTDAQHGPAGAVGWQLMRRSPRIGCPNCGRPTVSQAELAAVSARLQPNPAMQQRLSLCVECKSWAI